MSPGGGHLQRPFAPLLSFHVSIVQVGPLRRGRCPHRGRFHPLFPPQMGRQLPDVLHRVHRQTVGQGGFSGIGGGQIQRLDARVPGRHGHGQYALHRPQAPLQAQLPQKRRRLPWQFDAVRGRQNAQQNGQIIDGAGLFGARRGQIQRNAADGKAETAVFHRGPDPVPCLLDGGIGQAHHIKSRQAVGNIAFHLDLVAVETRQTQGADAAQHTVPPSWAHSTQNTWFTIQQTR